MSFALGTASPAKPGDTIWLRGGTYKGAHTSYLNGTASAPIIVRQYPGERAIVDGGNSQAKPAFLAYGNYTWFWGFEVFSSDPFRISNYPGPWPADLTRGSLETYNDVGHGVGVKFINMVVHDLMGSGLWKEAKNSEVYGCLIYYNGWVTPGDDAHGHGIYAQNGDGTMRFVNNFLFKSFGHGFHAYTEGSVINNMYLEGNTIFMNGEISEYGQRNLLIGGATTAQNPTVIDNYLYSSNHTTAAKLGYASPISNGVVRNNYIATQGKALEMYDARALTMTGNTFYGFVEGFSQASYPNNTYLGTARPRGTKVFVRPNAYESGRANITVYNWDGAGSISVDVSSVLKAGDSYEVRDVENFFGAPVASGTFQGGTISVPMNSTTVSPIVGKTTMAVKHSPSEFGAFVLLKTSGGSANKAPVVNAGPDQSVTIPAAATLNGSVTDDGQPDGTLTMFWSKLSGPGTVTFGSMNKAVTTATFSAAGTYDLRLEASDGKLATTDQVRVTVAGAASTHPISGVSVAAVSATGATIVWTTSEPMNSRVNYGATTAYGKSTPLDRKMVTAHSVTLAGLTPGSLYNYRVRSRNAAGKLYTSGNHTFQTPASGPVMISLEAESGKLTAPMAISSNSNASAGKYVSSTVRDSGSVEFTVNLPVAGDYVIWCRTLAPSADEDSTFVSVDGGAEDVYDMAEGLWSTAWQWTRVTGRDGQAPATLNPRVFRLSAGTHTIKFRSRETKSILDRLTITNDLNYKP